MVKRYAIKQRLSYWFDNTMARGTGALILWLFVGTAILLLLVTTLVTLTPDGNQYSYGQLVWMSLMRTLDPGTMGTDEGGWPFLFLMFTVTVGGIFVVGTLIGIITNGIDARLMELRKGRSIVIERGHTVILGWSPQIFAILSELVKANANRPKSCVAILAEKNKVEMEDEIHERVGNNGRTHIVCRSGNPIDLTDLEIINPQEARSIIILAPEADDPDSQVIKTVLAITQYPSHASNKNHVVAEIRDQKNLDVARLIGKSRVLFVQKDALIARITAQTCRQSGLSVVYTELLDFEGDEIYFQSENGLVGKTYGEALLAYEDSAMIGLGFADGRVKLNPPMDTIIQEGDRVIAISADDDTIRLSTRTEVPVYTEHIRNPAPGPKLPERTLILGWNRRAPEIVNELEHYVSPGSKTMIVAEASEAEAALACYCDHLEKQEISFRQGNISDRRTLENLGVGNFQHVIILSYSDTHEPQQADARTLITLLHLRDLSERLQNPFSIVSEILDLRNRALAEVTRADDFIVSDKLISLMLSQLSENKELSRVFEDLFDPQGAEIYLKPAHYYVELGQTLNFYTVVESARRRGHTAIGYRLHSESEKSGSYGVYVNPDKAKPLSFSPGDRIIVLAEEE